MNRAELKERARFQLGNNIFSEKWITGVLVSFIISAISTAAASIIPGLGGLLIFGGVAFGGAYLYVKQARDLQKMELGDIFKGYSVDAGGVTILGIMVTIFTALWSLLLIIPGIIKALSYSMAFYIKADHPEYDWRQCITESQRMMDGHKGELFMLYLSFIGWFIIGSLIVGLGAFWVVTYMDATKAQFYLQLKRNSEGEFYANYSNNDAF